MENNQIAMILIVVLGIMLFILLGLVSVWIFLKFKMKNENEKKNDPIARSGLNSEKKSKVQETYNIQSVFDFMEFDKIEDNMIVQKKGKRYIMIVQCQGINYDLMSGVEKSSVEQGFIQYLNTLRYPVQIYVQTRTVDLTGSISTYKERVKNIGDKLAEREFEYNKKMRSGDANKASLEKDKFELVKAKNLYEYGLDIVNNTERMSLNKNILSKQYYIILAYYPEESSEGIYSQDEIRNIAFSELYTRSQSTISLLSVCGINGKILDSMEIADLLYSAYNRDEAEMYDLNKAINSGFDSMYVTAPDVLDKRMKELDKQIEIDAITRANEAVYKARQESEKEKQLRKKEKELEESIVRLAKMIIDDNEDILGEDVVERAKENIDKEEEKANEQKKTKRVGRPRKTA